MRNAIGKDMLKGLQKTFEAISKDSSVKVLLLCSKVPKVFCAGADLKVKQSNCIFPEINACICICIWMFRLMFFRL